MFILLAFVCAVQATQWGVLQTWQGTTCTGTPSLFVASVNPACTPGAACICGGGFCTQVACTSAPNIPANLAGVAAYTSGGCNLADLNSVLGYVDGTCASSSAASYKVSCSSGSFRVDTYAAPNCGGASNSATTQFGCISSGAGSVRSTCSTTNPSATSTNVNVTFTFSASLSATQVTAVATLVATQTKLTVDVVASATTGQTVVLNIKGTDAGVWGRFYYGNGNINGNLFTVQDGSLPGVTRADVTAGARVVAGLALVTLLLALFM